MSCVELEAALDLNPDYADAHAMMATAMLEEGDLAAAQSWVDRARVLGADSDLLKAVQDRIREVVRRTT